MTDSTDSLVYFTEEERGGEMVNHLRDFICLGLRVGSRPPVSMVTLNLHTKKKNI